MKSHYHAKATRIIDTYIGDQIKRARKGADMSRAELAKKVHLTGAMVQKYEDARARVTVARLGDFCTALKKPFSYFVPSDFGKFMVALLTMGLLSGCMATGAVYQASSIPPVKSGKAQVILYRPSALALSGVTGEVEINGVNKCDLGVNGYMVESVDPGHIVVAVDSWQLPGTSKLSFDAKAGQKYYVKVSPNGGKATAGAIAGYIGFLASEAASEQKGPFVIEPIAKGQALGDLMDTKATCK